VSIFFGRKTFSFARTINGLTSPFFPADIGYIAPHPENDPSGDIFKIVRVQGNQYLPWLLFLDQVQHAIENMAKFDTFKCEYNVKDGTNSLIQALKVTVDDVEMFSFGGGGMLILNLKNLQNLFMVQDKDFNERFEIMMDTLFS
jgi:hypothetical protein